jgi:hypothetical protein
MVLYILTFTQGLPSWSPMTSTLAITTPRTTNLQRTNAVATLLSSYMNHIQIQVKQSHNTPMEAQGEEDV